MPGRMEDRRAHAVVIGGSVAGLFAARVLSDHFEQVTILERDPISDRPESRKGQPQTRHLHGLLAQGLEIIGRRFPGVERALVEGGAVTGDIGEIMRWYHFDGYKVQFHSGLVGMMMSRPFLEWHVRRRVAALSNVTIRSSCTVTGLLSSSERQRVVGVRCTSGTPGAEAGEVSADLVVDAAGRGSAGLKYLEDLGYPRPPEESVKVRVGYATRLYRRRAGDLQGARLVIIFPTPPRQKRLTILLPIEGDRWIVTAGGWAGDYPPGDVSGFTEFVRSLPAPDVFDVIRRVEPLSDVVTHRFPANLRRRYEKLRRFPDGYLVVGDAVASFNPIYGQGMTSAALQAEALDEVLRRRPALRGLWRPAFKRIAGVVDIPWQLAVGEDYRYPETEGDKPVFTDFLNAYVAGVHRATHHDPVVSAQFLRVMNLMDRPSSLLAPRIAWRVLRPAVMPRVFRRRLTIPPVTEA